MRVAIIGAGLQGRRRGLALRRTKDSEPVIVTARHLADAQRLACDLNCEAGAGWQEAVSREDIDAVVVCTPPDSHADISIRALELGKHVLCEKPLSRTASEGDAMLRAARAAK